MSQENPPQASKSSVEDAMRTARALMAAGILKEQLRDKLNEQGFDATTIRAVLYRLDSEQRPIQMPTTNSIPIGGSSGQRDMAIGCIICIIGIVVTFFTYTAASSNPGGGTYVVAWGAIIFGAIRFFRGLMSAG
jgi:hypothetical protein